MSTDTPPRGEDTQELIKRFRVRRARRRRLAIVGTIIAIIVVVGGGATALALALSNHSTGLAASTTAPDGGTAPAQGTPASLAQTGTAGASTAETGATEAGATTTGSGGTTTPSSTSTSASTSTSTSSSTSTTASTSTSVKQTTTSQPTTSTTHASSTTTGAGATAASTKVVVIDPGHQAKADNSPEPIGPGSSTTKPKVASGTAGVTTGVPESKLALAVGLKLKDSLEAHGIKVVMTRTTQNVNISNSQRAQIANKAHADLFIRIHADGSTDHSTHGIHVLYPASIKGWTDDIAIPSKKAAQLAEQDLIAATGAANRGIDARSDMSGFNWSNVPTIIPEIGFMTNPTEDKLLETSAYQDKVVQGLTEAILAFLGMK